MVNAAQRAGFEIIATSGNSGQRRRPARGGVRAAPSSVLASDTHGRRARATVNGRAVSIVIRARTWHR